MPVGTTDYIAPEVLAVMNESNDAGAYGVSCVLTKKPTLIASS